MNQPGDEVSDGFRAAGIARLAPIAEHQTEVDQRIADGSHLPIEHGFDAAGIRLVEHHIVELEIVVDQGGRGRFRQVLAQPAQQMIHVGDLFGLGALPNARPSREPGARGNRRACPAM